MGYRSEVAVKICCPIGFTAERIWNSYKEAVVANGGTTKYIDNIFPTVKMLGNVLIIHGDGLKWYSDYPEVKAMDSLLEGIEVMTTDCGGGYHFMRIGEDYDDVEQRYYGEVDNYLNCVRYIDLNDEYDGKEADECGKSC